MPNDFVERHLPQYTGEQRAAAAPSAKITTGQRVSEALHISADELG